MRGRIEQDLKEAMLSGDKAKTETLRILKSALQNEAINQKAQDTGLSDEQIQRVLSSEAKKRAEAAELYKNAGETERAEKELAEKQVIEAYLPEQMSEEELASLIDKHIQTLGASGMADMGKVIGAVKAEAGVSADGGAIARIAKEKLQ